ncbi:hypothetical protein TCON_0910 [Astathelohania contejeani]|uniref:Uncharacterized protein n=1 Tax=Astathelohania contejeani TaxID=164912 RepID=A0ABQ7I0D7_9MICR|nr:hypothetical protein TCON_0910 [Thelohania contejeani]
MLKEQLKLLKQKRKTTELRTKPLFSPSEDMDDELLFEMLPKLPIHSQLLSRKSIRFNRKYITTQQNGQLSINVRRLMRQLLPYMETEGMEYLLDYMCRKYLISTCHTHELVWLVLPFPRFHSGLNRLDTMEIQAPYSPRCIGLTMVHNLQLCILFKEYFEYYKILKEFIKEVYSFYLTAIPAVDENRAVLLFEQIQFLVSQNENKFARFIYLKIKSKLDVECKEIDLLMQSIEEEEENKCCDLIETKIIQESDRHLIKDYNKLIEYFQWLENNPGANSDFSFQEREFLLYGKGEMDIEFINQIEPKDKMIIKFIESNIDISKIVLSQIDIKNILSTRKDLYLNLLNENTFELVIKLMDKIVLFEKRNEILRICMSFCNFKWELFNDIFTDDDLKKAKFLDDTPNPHFIGNLINIYQNRKIDPPIKYLFNYLENETVVEYLMSLDYIYTLKEIKILVEHKTDLRVVFNFFKKQPKVTNKLINEILSDIHYDPLIDVDLFDLLKERINVINPKTATKILVTFAPSHNKYELCDIYTHLVMHLFNLGFITPNAHFMHILIKKYPLSNLISNINETNYKDIFKMLERDTDRIYFIECILKTTQLISFIIKEPTLFRLLSHFYSSDLWTRAKIIIENGFKMRKESHEYILLKLFSIELDNPLLEKLLDINIKSSLKEELLRLALNRKPSVSVIYKLCQDVNVKKYIPSIIRLGISDFDSQLNVFALKALAADLIDKYDNLMVPYLSELLKRIELNNLERIDPRLALKEILKVPNRINYLTDILSRLSSPITMPSGVFEYLRGIKDKKCVITLLNTLDKSCYSQAKIYLDELHHESPQFLYSIFSDYGNCELFYKYIEEAINLIKIGEYYPIPAFRMYYKSGGDIIPDGIVDILYQAYLNEPSKEIKLCIVELIKCSEELMKYINRKLIEVDRNDEKMVASSVELLVELYSGVKGMGGCVKESLPYLVLLVDNKNAQIRRLGDRLVEAIEKRIGRSPFSNEGVW